jgi:quinone-modifying oxidoreductase subunit QmoA
MSNSILVVGGGFSGITAALEAAEVGYEVFLIEKNPYLGGRVAQLNQYFPKLCPPSCGLEIQFQRIRKNPKVKVYTLAEVVGISGAPGEYEVKIKLKPRYVNSKCTGCNACVDVCSTEVPCEFDFGLSKRKAMYRPHLFSFPLRYVLDKDICTDEELNAMYAACKYSAIDLNEEEKIFTINVGSIVWATGWKPYDVTNLTNLGAGAIPNVISNMQMERLAAPNGPTNGKLLRPSDNAKVKKVAFVQCAGSRDQNHLNFCSYICCMASLKQATYVRSRYSDAEVTIYYIDLRTPGRYDKFLRQVTADDKVRLVKGKVAGIEAGPSGDVILEVEDAVKGVKKKVRHDLVVLATGMQPSIAGGKLPAGVLADEDGFVLGEAEKGIFAAGCARVPLDVTRSAQSATGAALKAIQTVVGR